MALETFPWDSAELLESPEDIAAYIEAAFEDGDPSVVTHALGVVARAKRHVAGRARFRSLARGSLQGADDRRRPEAFHLFRCAEGSGDESHGPGGVTGMRQDAAARARPERPIATPLTQTLSPLMRGEGVADAFVALCARAAAP
jgi:probable addiction module antidote protein